MYFSLVTHHDTWELLEYIKLASSDNVYNSTMFATKQGVIDWSMILVSDMQIFDGLLILLTEQKLMGQNILVILLAHTKLCMELKK